MKIATIVGSMPHLSPDEALDIIMRRTPHLVAWPQLPRRSFLENMTAQYSENFPGLLRDEDKKRVYVSMDDALAGLEKFYEKYLAGDIGYFSISSSVAAGLHALLKRVGSGHYSLSNPASGPFSVKCQTAGPVTFAMMLKDENDRPVFFDENLRDVAIKNIAMKSVWQIKAFGGACRTIFLDEPYLSAYGSAFTALSREDVVETLRETFAEVRRLTPDGGISIGAHCCGNTDWSLLVDGGADIISFDSHGFAESLALSADSIKTFLERGGRLAWGAVPTSAELLAAETPQTLKARLEAAVSLLVSKGLDEKLLRERMLITPACGLGSLDEETAQLALEYTQALAESL
ncbi:MAG: methionine synthase [Endomicrobiia bacterium]|nr:methionine synthase [Endomicrobiia bacterium]